MSNTRYRGLQRAHLALCKRVSREAVFSLGGCTGSVSGGNHGTSGGGRKWWTGRGLGLQSASKTKVSPSASQPFSLRTKWGCCGEQERAVWDFRVYEACLSVHNIIGHLGQRRAYVEQTIKNSSWDHRERGYCRNLFLESQM